MHWLEVAVTVLFGLLGQAFFYGRLTQKVSSHSEKLIEHTGKLEKHDDLLRTHGERIAGLEG